MTVTTTAQKVKDAHSYSFALTLHLVWPCLTPPLYLAWKSSMTLTGKVDADKMTSVSKFEPHLTQIKGPFKDNALTEVYTPFYSIFITFFKLSIPFEHHFEYRPVWPLHCTWPGNLPWPWPAKSRPTKWRSWLTQETSCKWGCWRVHRWSWWSPMQKRIILSHMIFGSSDLWQ